MEAVSLHKQENIAKNMIALCDSHPLPFLFFLGPGGGREQIDEKTKVTDQEKSNNSQVPHVPELGEGASWGRESKAMPGGSLCSIINDVWDTCGDPISWKPESVDPLPLTRS